jgi:hypothetical protein
MDPRRDLTTGHRRHRGLIIRRQGLIRPRRVGLTGLRQAVVRHRRHPVHRRHPDRRLNKTSDGRIFVLDMRGSGFATAYLCGPR